MNLTSELAGETLIVRVGEHRIDGRLENFFWSLSSYFFNLNTTFY